MPRGAGMSACPPIPSHTCTCTRRLLATLAPRLSHRLAAMLCGEWNVMGADLFNEPHRASWGGPDQTDWAAAAERLAETVHRHCPRWLIFVQGVSDWAAAADGAASQYYWGENLVSVSITIEQYYYCECYYCYCYYYCR